MPTVSHRLRPLKLSRVKDTEPRPTIVCCERKTPGEIIHMDIKVPGCFVKLGHRVIGRHIGMARTPLGAGWEYLNAAIDDQSHIGFVRLTLDETARRATAFL